MPRTTEVSSVVHHSNTKPEDINLMGQNIRISKICKLCSAGWVGGGRVEGGGEYIILAVTMAAGSTGRVVAVLLLQ